MSIAALINKANAKGIKLWQKDGQLKFKAPKGVWTDEIRQEIIANKEAIIAFLRQISKEGKIPSIVPVSRTDEEGNPIESFPLSFAQERLWFIDQLEPDSAGYNIPKAVSISGEIDIAHLEQAFNQIIARHENLRTIFPGKESQGRQVVLDRLDFKLEPIDLSHYKNNEARHRKAQQLCENEAARPFNLSKGPLIRGKLIKLSAQEHILLLIMHHIITDAWSTGVLIKEFGLIMDCLRQGKNPDLPPLPIQYLDYSIWQRKLLGEGRPEQEGLLEQQLAYWQKKLAGIPESLNLATDYPRPSVQSLAGHRQTFRLDVQLTSQLKSLAEQQGCTLFMTLLSVFKVMLYRYTGEEDICLGSPIANRQYKETEGLIGMFVNTLALRSQIDGQDSFISLLATVKKTCLEAYKHQDTPFEKIVDLVQPQRNMSINPIFQIMIDVQNAPKKASEQLIQLYPLKSDISKFDLSLGFIETTEGLEGEIEYSTSLYKPQTIERMAKHLTTLCQAIIKTPTAKINELEFIGEAEKQQLLIDYNQTQTDYPKDKCIHQLFVEQVLINPDKIAVVYQDDSLTYQQLYDKSQTLALYLQSLGVKPETLVGLCLERSLEMMVGILGILQAGGAYVPLDPDYPDDRLAYMLEDSKTTIVLSQDKLKDKLSTLVSQDTQLVSLDTQWLEISHCVTDLKTNEVDLCQEVQPHHLAYVIYTSGSTGQPKGVMVEHQGVMNTVTWFINHFNISQNAEMVLLTDYTFDPSVEDIFGTFLTGATLHIPTTELILNENQLINYIDKNNICGLNFVPTILHNLLCNHKKLESIEYVVSGGEKLADHIKDDILAKGYALYNNYGPTEITIDALSAKCTSDQVVIGTPINNTQVYILDQHNNPVPMGVPGELHIAGDGLARGYLHRPELTEEKFIPNPFTFDQNSSSTRMYKSGDLVRWLDDGNIEYLGRIDTQVKVRGFRIETGEIEAQLNQYSEIKDSVVVVQGQEGNKQLIAYFVATEDATGPSNEELKTHLLQSLPEYMLPAAFVSLEIIPLTPNGKVDRCALESMDVNLESSEAYLAPRNRMEKQLVAIWAEVLDIELEKIGISDNFFELGGDSIKTIQVVSKAIEHHIYFNVRDMFNYQNIHELLKHCDTTKSREIIKEEGILQGAVDLSPIQSDFFKHTQTDVHHFNQSVLLNLNVSLSVEDLQELITVLVEQHDVLRLRYTKGDNGWQQYYLDIVANAPETLGIHFYDIATIDEKQIPDYVEKTCNHWQAQLDLENGPIMRWVYFDSNNKGIDQLAIIIHHLAIDGVSWRILLEDLNQLIGQQLEKKKLQLSKKRSSYRNWVDSLATYKDSEQGKKDLTFWIGQSKKAQGINKAFVDKPYRSKDIKQANVLLSKSDTEKLLKHCHKAYGTDINDLLLTALMLSYYQATGDQKLMVDLEGHGREQIDPAIDITKTLGWFTSIYLVSFGLSNPRDIGQSIKDIKTALHEIPNKGVGFSIFQYINQDETIKDIPKAQVVFNFLGNFQSSEKESARNYFSFSENSSGNNSSQQKEVDRLVSINGLVVFEQLSFTFSYPEEWQGQKISHWQHYFISALEALIIHCYKAPRMGYTPSDFPLLSASLTQLNTLIPNLEQQGKIQLDNIQDIYPLTPLQSGILFETLYAQTEDNKGMYVTQSAIGINGQVDIKVLQQAWQLIVNHYDVLRMRLITDHIAKINMNLQVILKQIDIQINQIDWSEKTDKELKSACEQWMQQSKRSGISFNQASLMRMSLFKGQESSYLLFEQHHIVMDGWSQGIVLSNLFKLYQAFLRQQDYQLPPSAPYGAYVQTLLNRNQEEETLYWKEYLAHHEERTPLPLEYLSPGYNSAKESRARDVFDLSRFCLSTENTLKLEQLVKTHRLTMNTVLQFIWGLVLHLHSGNKTVTFGSVSSGRTGILDIKHSDQIVGMCINTTPTCIQFDTELSLLDQLKLMQGRESEKLSYETTPLVQIQEILEYNTNEDFFQSLFVYENYPVEKIADANSIIKDFIGNEAPNYPLSIAVVSQEILAISFTWDSYFYNEETITVLKDQFERLISQLLATPEATIKDVSLISEPEKQKLLTEYNQTQVYYPKDKCIHQLFMVQVAINPDKIALVSQDESLTYQQLYDKSHNLALYLQSLGVQPDSLVGLCVERSPEMMVGILGILQAGGAYVPLDPDYPEDRLAYMLEDSETAIVLSQDKLKDKLSNLVSQDTQLILLDTQWSEISDCVADLKAKQINLCQEVKPHHLSYVIYTSGSTGQPKGVMVEHRSLVNHMHWIINKFNLNERKTLLQKTSFNFDAAQWEFMVLIGGTKIVMGTPGIEKDPEKLINTIIENNITTLQCVPTLLKALSENNKFSQCDNLVDVFCGGELLNKSLVDEYRQLLPNSHLYNIYGPTECTIDVTAYDCSQLDGSVVPIGTPINNTQIYILDAFNKPQAVGVVGELHIAGDGLARGYLNRKELTQEKFVPNPFNPGTLMYKSGDLARWLGDGNVEYLGRMDTQVKIRGFRIETGDIEAQLNQYPEIQDSVVVVQEQEGNKQLIAYYVARDTKEDQVINLASEDLRAFLQKTLPDYMLPAVFVSLEAIPLMPNGKVNRRALERMDVSHESSQVYIAPRNRTEKQLVAIWAEVLNLEFDQVGVNDNFFELRGDSIKSIQIVSKAIEHHIYFDIRDMFKHQTIHDLLQHCDTTKSKEIIKEDGILQGVVGLSPIQSYFFEHIQTDVHHFNQSVLLNLNINLSVEDLQQLVIVLMEQHDVLRLRYTKDDSGWKQHYFGSVGNTPETLGIHSYDIATLDEKQIPDYIEETCNHWQAQLDLKNGPIMRWIYFDSKSDSSSKSNQLAIIIHHLVIDGVSWRIFLEDLNQLIGQQLTHQQLQLSKKRSSYRNWVNSLAAYKDSKQGQKDLEFWIEQNKKAQNFSNAFVAKAYRNEDIQHANVLLSKINTEKLLKHCHQAYGTNINDLLLTALMLSYYQSTGNKNLMVDLEGHGREQIDPAIDITKTLGWFTSIYPVCLDLSNPLDVGKSIKDIKTALHEIPNKGVGFSIFRYINQHAAIKEIPEAQVIFNFLGDFQSSKKQSGKNYFTFSENSSGNDSSLQKEVNKLVTINGLVVFDQLSFTFSYPKVWQGQKTSHWQTHFISALESLIKHCDASPRIGYTPSDFPLSGTSLWQLDNIMGVLEQQRNIKLDNIQDIYPLTALQSGILFETLYAQTEDNKGMYLTQSAIGIKGQVDSKVLQQAWQLILNHYDSLRMLVIPADFAGIDIDLQVILKQVEIQVNRIDWSEKADEELKSACELWMQESKRSGISFNETSLLQVTLFQGQESCYMLFEQHHIMLDGWSQSIVLRNLFKIYQALMQQQDYQLPPSAPHKAYVQSFLNRDQEDEIFYWKEYLACYEERTPLPMDHLSSQQDFAREIFDTCDLYLSKENSLKLEQLLKQHRLTMNTALQFIWGLLLHLHNGNETIIFGSVSSGRSGILDVKHSDQMVGLCINTTPTCIRFNADLSLLEQLKQMQSRESEKLNYEITPLIRIQELLGISTNEDFFQTLFIYENYPVEKISEANSIIQGFFGDDSPNYPLSITGASGEEIHVSFTYDGYYYKQETILTLIEQFERLILQLASSPEMPLKEVSLISAQEKQQLLIDYNKTQTDYPKDKCIHQLFIDQLVANPERTAIVYQDAELSYQQLYDRSYDLALYLQSLGVKPDTFVGICVERSLEMIVGVLGILQAGGAYVPLEPDYPDDRLAYMLDDSQVAIVLTQEKLREKLSSLVVADTKLVVLDQQGTEIQKCVNALKDENIQLFQKLAPNHLAYMIYTSGSTGQPKGVMVEHQGVVNTVSWFIRNFKINESSKLIQLTDYTFDPSVEDIFGSLSTGAVLHIPAIDLLLDESELIHYIREKEITGLNFVPGILKGLLCDYDKLDSIEFVISGGEKLDESVKDAIVKKGYALYNNYGPTETTIDVLSTKCTEQPVVIGNPIANTQVYILDQHNNPVPMGVPGELHIAGDGLARGYFNRPQLTDEKFIPNPFSLDQNSRDSRMYKSGDLVRWVSSMTGQNLIEYLGRVDTQVKIRGFRIETGEIESLLNQYSEIKGSVVVVQGQEENKKLIAFYVATDSTESELVEISNEDLKEYLQQSLPEYMLPATFVSLELFPLTPNGKMDRRALENLDVNLESSQDYLAPRNDMEKQLVAIWAEVLKLDQEKIGVNDNFFELGGHSLLATQVISKIRSQLEIDVPLKALFKANTVAGVSELIQALKVQHEKPVLNEDLADVEFEEFSL